jgi:heat shock protein HtpX
MPALFAANLRLERILERISRNDLHGLVLTAGLALITAISGWLLWSWTGVFTALASVALIFYGAPRLPPAAIMRLYRARPIDPGHGGQIIHVVNVLSKRAGLARAPTVYVIASLTANAFAAGTPQKAVIAVTEGLLRRLSLRELTGVLGHELSHIVNNDLPVMGLADVMTRFSQALSYLAVFLAVFHLPGLLLGDSDVSLSALLLLYLAPTLGSLLQLSLARAREFDADLFGASLTGDPAGLASALQHTERLQGTLWEDMMLPVPGRRIPVPSVLRTHPPTEARIRRLRELEHAHLPPPIEVPEEPMVSLAGLGPGTMRPRLRFPGVWF